MMHALDWRMCEDLQSFVQFCVSSVYFTDLALLCFLIFLFECLRFMTVLHFGTDEEKEFRSAYRETS